MMVHTNDLEKELQTGHSYADCFKGSDRRRTEICCMAWTVQYLSGFGIQGYTTYVFECVLLCRGLTIGKQDWLLKMHTR